MAEQDSNNGHTKMLAFVFVKCDDQEEPQALLWNSMTMHAPPAKLKCQSRPL